MSLPAMTWRQSALYPFAITDALTFLARVKIMVDTEYGVGGRWMVNFWDGAAGILELKRAGAPTGLLAAQRVLLFGAAGAPSVNALDASVTATVGNVYCYYSLDEATTGAGPTVSPFANDPYPLATLKSKGWNVLSSIPGGAILFGQILDCEEGLLLKFDSTGGSYTVLIGRMLDDGVTGKWMKSVSSFMNANPSSEQNPYFVAGLYDTPGPTYAASAYIDEVGGAQVSLGRLFKILDNLGALAGSSLGGILHSIAMVGRPRGGAGTWQYQGTLRQMRYGPTLADRTIIYSGATVAGFVVTPNYGSPLSIVLDQTP